MNAGKRGERLSVRMESMHVGEVSMIMVLGRFAGMYALNFIISIHSSFSLLLFFFFFFKKGKTKNKQKNTLLPCCLCPVGLFLQSHPN